MLKIEVTAEDIANGVRMDGECCPVALAIRRIFPGVQDLEVDGDASWETKEGRFIARFPDVAKEFIGSFDRGGMVDPLVFECDPILYQYGRYGDYGDDD